MWALHFVSRPALAILALNQACHPTSAQKDASLRQLDAADLGSAEAPTANRTTAASTTNASTNQASTNQASTNQASTNQASTNQASTNQGSKPAELAPLTESGRLVELAVPGFRDAVVSVPLRTTKPRPVVLALHGNYDRPEWQCEVMREITAAYAFILCPRGIPRHDAPKVENRWEYGSVQQLRKEIEAGLTAMTTRFAGYVAEGPIVFTGFSLGAILGRPIVASEPERFPRVVFTEGGGDGWNFKQFRQRGGLRVLFGCAQRGCPEARRNLVRNAAAAGVEVRIADGGNLGHTYDGPVARAISAEWAWLIEGDERWSEP